ncbi:von Willebrand factor type A domain [Pelomyxa schiedti]|nr:von Willebrand factor type A domain [Pelomyxa schiedti]
MLFWGLYEVDSDGAVTRLRYEHTPGNNIATVSDYLVRSLVSRDPGNSIRKSYIHQNVMFYVAGRPDAVMVCCSWAPDYVSGGGGSSAARRPLSFRECWAFNEEMLDRLPVRPPPAVSGAPPRFAGGAIVGGVRKQYAVMRVTNGPMIEVPLTKVAVTGTLNGLLGEYTITYTFTNDSANSLEVEFWFPSTPQATIRRFITTIGEKTIVGRCMKSNAASDKYDDAISRGNSATLVESKGEIIKLSLGNLAPHLMAIVSITCICQLLVQPSHNGQIWKFVLPASSVPLLPRSSSISLDINMDIKLPPCDNVTLESPSHTITTTTTASANARLFTVSLSLAAMERDFNLNVNMIGIKPLSCIGEYNSASDTTCLALLFTPSISIEETINTELVFLVDRSGSMAGHQIEQAVLSLQLFLRSIPVGNRINVVGFGSTFVKMFPTSVPYTQQQLEIASAAVSAIQADLGGTNLLAPLRDVLQQPVPPNFSRKVIVITDGAVEDTSSVFEAVSLRHHRDDCTVFALGIGDCCRELVTGLAERGNGFADFVLQDERIEPSVMRLLSYALECKIEDVSVNWGYPTSVYYPSNLSTFNHSSKFVFAYSNGRILSHKDGQIIVTGRGGNNPIEVSLPHSEFEVVEGDSLHCHGARTRILELENAGNTAAKNEMITISCKYGVLCSETSYVAECARTDSASGSMTHALITSSPVPAATGCPTFDAFQSTWEDRVTRVRSEIEGTRSIVTQNIEKVLERGEKIEQVIATTESLGAGSSFRRRQTPLRQKSGTSDLLTQGAELLSQAKVSITSLFASVVSAVNNFSSPASPTSNNPPALTQTTTRTPISSTTPAPSPDDAPKESPQPTTGTLPNTSTPAAPCDTQHTPETCTTSSSATPIDPTATTPCSTNNATTSPPSGKTLDQHQLLSKLIMFQRADGSWPHTCIDQVAELMGFQWESATPPPVILPTSTTRPVTKEELDCLWVSHIVLAYLKVALAALEEEWQLLYQKAMSWANKEARRLSLDHGAFLSSATKFVESLG